MTIRLRFFFLIPTLIATALFSVQSALHADTLTASERRDVVESLSRERDASARRAEREGTRAAEEAEAFIARAEEARLAAGAAGDSTDLVRLDWAERIAMRHAQLAEARGRRAADRLRRIEAELANRELDLEILLNKAEREQAALEIEDLILDEDQLESLRASARRTWNDLLGRMRQARDEMRGIEAEIRRARTEREKIEIALLRVEIQGSRFAEDQKLVRENRTLLRELSSVLGEDARELTAVAAEYAERRTILMEEVRRYTDYEADLGRALLEARFRALISQSGTRGFENLAAALALALVLYLMLRFRRPGPALLKPFFTKTSETELRQNIDLVLLSAAILLVITALATMLGYTPLAVYVLSRGATTLVMLPVAGFLMKTLSRRFDARLTLKYRFLQIVVVGFTVLVLAWIWNIPMRPSLILLLRYAMPHVSRIARVVFLVLSIGFVLYLARSVVTVIVRAVTAPSSRDGLEDYERRFDTVLRVLRRFTAVVIVLAGILLLLREFGFDVVPLLAGAGIAGIALGLGAQSLVKDFLSGFFILMENQYRVGDIIRIGDRSGLVEHLGLRTTVMRDLEGIVHIVPNGEITSVSNMTHEWSRAVLDIDVSYTSDLDKVRNVLIEIGREMQSDPAFGPLITEDPEVLGVESFNDSSITVRMLVRTRPMKQWDVAREMRLRIKRTFDREGIEIPFPQRVVHIEKRPIEPADVRE